MILIITGIGKWENIMLHNELTIIQMLNGSLGWWVRIVLYDSATSVNKFDSSNILVNCGCWFWIWIMFELEIPRNNESRLNARSGSKPTNRTALNTFHNEAFLPEWRWFLISCEALHWCRSMLWEKELHLTRSISSVTHDHHRQIAAYHLKRWKTIQNRSYKTQCLIVYTHTRGNAHTRMWYKFCAIPLKYFCFWRKHKHAPAYDIHIGKIRIHFELNRNHHRHRNVHTSNQQYTHTPA